MSHLTYSRALTRVAAGGDVPPGLERHLAACPDCAAELRSLRRALELVDEHLGELVAASPPAQLGIRIARDSAIEPAPRGNRSRWRDAGAGLTVAAVLILALTLFDERPHSEPVALEPEVLRVDPEQVLPDRPERPAGVASLVPPARPPVPIPRRSAAAPPPFGEVVVLSGQLESLTRLAADPERPWPHPMEERPIQIEALRVEALEIEPLVIPPL
jgi:hypothetical protein